MTSPGFFFKELKETVKTPRFVVLLCLFLFFSFVGPLTAKYMHELMGMLASDIEIILPEPTKFQAWEQFYSNLTSLCLIVLLILISGTVSSEKSKGSIMLVLTKRVSRLNFIMSKILANVLLFTFVYFAATGVSAYYTYVLFDSVLYNGLGTSLLMLWLLGIFYVNIAVFSSVISKSPTIAAFISFGIYAVLNILSIAKDFLPFNPTGGSIFVLQILSTNYNASHITTNIGASIIASILTATASVLIFQKQEI